LLRDANENHENPVIKIVVPLRLEMGTSRILVRASLLQKSARYIPVCWKGVPPECTLELLCYKSLFGTFRSTGRGHLRECWSVSVQICSLQSGVLEVGPSGMHVRASLLYKSLRYVPVYWKGTPARMLERPCTNLLGTFCSDCKGVTWRIHVLESLMYV
jgi:hypothetical protein